MPTSKTLPGKRSSQRFFHGPRELFWLLVLMLVGVSLVACGSGCNEPQRREPVATPQAPPSKGPPAVGSDSMLQRSEALGGHTLRKHVGRTDAELVERLRAEPRISASSSFTDEATAERVIRAGIAQNQAAITGWLSEGASRRLPIDYRGDTPIGRGIGRNEPEVGPRTNAHIILERNVPRPDGAPEAGDGYHVLTAYPQ